MLNQQQCDLAAEECQDNESGESHVDFQEPGASEVEEEDQDEGGDGDDDDEVQGVEECCEEFVPSGFGRCFAVSHGDCARHRCVEGRRIAVEN